MPERRPIILVVDDDEPILLLMRSLLREFGFTPLTAGSGPAAIEEAQRCTPDLVLLDRNMPGMSGDEVVTAMRGHSALTDVPVLMLTGEPMAPAEIASLGVTGAILKPFDIAALVGAIRATLSK